MSDFVVIGTCCIRRNLIIAVSIDINSEYKIYKIYTEKESIEGYFDEKIDLISQCETIFKDEEKNYDYFVRFYNTWINVEYLKHIKYHGLNNIKSKIFIISLQNCEHKEICIHIYLNTQEYQMRKQI
jgi:hypothetical protein